MYYALTWYDYETELALTTELHSRGRKERLGILYDAGEMISLVRKHVPQQLVCTSRQPHAT